MTETQVTIGKTTIAPEVLLSIARLTTLGTQGVSRLGSIPGNLFKRDPNHGVEITVENNVVYVDIYVILDNDVDIRETCRNIQKHISRAISEMVGMEVGQINIHVDDIDYGPGKDILGE
ncbi:MAG: Asp23/Gls24 family envelope stress response protein [Anaerolineaceae bacterium]|nr:Asp23/Gls24 family envelope stress response protein [Anaerolineaceae bacterium]MBN2678548.1 Asp23/Gls24 family envelope stress response protein [Anaerolineaceae bacterium]